jgi:hypothetical protein
LKTQGKIRTGISDVSSSSSSGGGGGGGGGGSYNCPCALTEHAMKAYGGLDV